MASGLAPRSNGTAPRENLAHDQREHVVVVVQFEEMLGPDLRWPLRIATLAGERVTLLIALRSRENNERVRLDLASVEAIPAAHRQIAQKLQQCLDQQLGQGTWRAFSNGNQRAAADGDQDPGIGIDAWLLPPAGMLATIKEVLGSSRTARVLFVNRADPAYRNEVTALLQSALRELACAMAEIIPGERQEAGRILWLAGRNENSHAALGLAAALAEQSERPWTALYVQSDIGPDAAAVGRRILAQRLASLSPETSSAGPDRRVEVDADVVEGILQVCRDETFEVVLAGADRASGLGGRQPKSIRNRLMAGSPEPTLIVTRAALAVHNRVALWFTNHLRRWMPQLDRNDRVELVERVQSASVWNFDFILMLSLAAVIAALGLLENSPAVIIGAMLVAPLMSPLLGSGLALSQSNPQLLRVTLRTALLGFVTVFGLSWLIGCLASDFHIATVEMQVRHWPRHRDLLIALVSGIAAAYAYGRPGLLAALPGVAIATSLVPPVATSGLAASIGDWRMAAGAFLLFVVNAIAIVAGAAMTLRAMGLRHIAKNDAMVDWLGRVVLGLTLVAMVVLTVAPPRLAPRQELVRTLERELGERFRVRNLQLQQEPAGLTLQLDLAGAVAPEAGSAARLQQVAQEFLGIDVRLRLTHQLEQLAD